MFPFSCLIFLYSLSFFFFFFNDTATTEIYTLSLHDALPICWGVTAAEAHYAAARHRRPRLSSRAWSGRDRSEEHTSELQSRVDLVCRLLLEKKKKKEKKTKQIRKKQ